MILKELWEEDGMLQLVEQQEALADFDAVQRMPEPLITQQIRQPPIPPRRNRNRLEKLVDRLINCTFDTPTHRSLRLYAQDQTVYG